MIEQALDPLTTRYVAVSKATRNYGVATGIMAQDKVDVVYNAIELDDKIPVTRSQARRLLGLRDDATVIGTLSRCEQQKGLEYLIRAARLVDSADSCVQFVIVGDGPLRAELTALRDQLCLGECVVFAGWRDDIAAALSAMDIYCMASLWEQAPLAIAEAMAMRLPVVATAVDGIPEMVIDGYTVILVPPQDPRALADALLELIANRGRAKSMGEAGRERAIEYFSIDGMIAQYDEIFWHLFTTRAAAKHGIGSTGSNGRGLR